MKANKKKRVGPTMSTLLFYTLVLRGTSSFRQICETLINFQQKQSRMTSKYGAHKSRFEVKPTVAMKSSIDAKSNKFSVFSDAFTAGV